MEILWAMYDTKPRRKKKNIETYVDVQIALIRVTSYLIKVAVP
jgi:hypothetical protein